MTKQVRLDTVCDMNSGGTPRREFAQYYGGNIKWAKISDIENAEGGYLSKTEETITEAGLRSINDRIFPEKTLLLAMYGSVGKTAITSERMATNQAILGIRPKADAKVDLHYLKYWLDSVKPRLIHRAVGGTLQNISLKIVSELNIPLPPLPIQKKIAAILDKADSLRQKDKQLLEHYNQLAQSIFYEMFGDPVRNEKGWVVDIIQNLVNIDRPITYGILKPGENIKPLGVPYVRVVDIKRGEVLIDQVNYTTHEIANQYKRSTLKQNDILYSIRGHVGRSCIVRKELEGANITQDTARLDFSGKLNSHFALSYLNSSEFDRIVRPLVRGAAVKGLNLGDLRKLPIPIPPMEKQNKFGQAMTLLNDQRAKCVCSIKESEALFQSLLQKAFKGELVKEA